jgi:hypothetical protein
MVGLVGYFRAYINDGFLTLCRPFFARSGEKWPAKSEGDSSAYNFGESDQFHSRFRFADAPVLDYHAAVARPRGFAKHNERTLYDNAN